MIDYNAFHTYLTELVGLYQRAHSTKGMSQLAQKHHCTAITRDQFYQMKLDKLQPTQVTPQLSRVIRDTIGKSDAKATLRESIGALNEGILANSRISQGSDSTVQITITQPMQQGVSVVQHVTSPDTDKGAQVAQPPVQQKPAYRVGHVAYQKGTTGWRLFLIDRVGYDSLGYHYTLVIDQYGKEILSAWPEGDIGRSTALCDKSLRPAKGSEVARFLGALTREGYLWEADNVNGTFTVKGKKIQRQEQPKDVCATDIPQHGDSNTGIHSLPAISPSPYRFALGPLVPVDNADDLMTSCYDTQMLNAVVRQVRTVFHGFDHIRELFEYEMPALCCSEEIKEYRVALVKDSNNGTSYWLARDRDVLRLLSWISFIV